MDLSEILDFGTKVALDIQNSEDYLKLREILELMNSSEETKKLIIDFKKAKEDYNEVSKYGDFHPDLSKSKQELARAKTELFSHPLYLEYTSQLKKVNQTLQLVEHEIENAIFYSSEIKLLCKKD